MDTLSETETWLRDAESVVGRTLLMPLQPGTKRPMFKHKESWGWPQFNKFMMTRGYNATTHWGLLLDKLIVLDCDDAASVELVEQQHGSHLVGCAIQETLHGRHYVFARPSFADAEGYWDGARQVHGAKVDVKTRCSTGTRGVLSITPSANKTWVEGRAPWDIAGGLREMPRELLESFAVPRPSMEKLRERARVAKRRAATEIDGNNGSNDSDLGGSVDVMELLELLKPGRWDDRRTWMLVAIALKGLDDKGVAYKDVWLRHSARSAKFDRAAAEELWSTVARPDYEGPRVTLGTIHRMAQKDAPDQYACYRTQVTLRKMALDLGEDASSSSSSIVDGSSSNNPPPITVNVPFISTKNDAIEAAVQSWLDGEVDVLSVKSPMGTGKSTFQDRLLRHPALEAASILCVTYRQSLAMEQENKLMNHGFVSYAKFTRDAQDDPLSDRQKYPRVICQVESLDRLEGRLEGFDLVIMDETESLLRHFMSPTVTTPSATLGYLIGLVRNAKFGALSMDAMWGSLTSDVLKLAGLSTQLILNETPVPSPHKFRVAKDLPRWLSQIVEDVKAGKNVVIVTMSSEIAERVASLLTGRTAHHRAEASSSGEVFVDPGRVLLHTSKTSDALKAQLAKVDELWVMYQVVIYTPTIAAGVDFSVDHFDRMYLYACSMSCLPATAMQMLFRVRRLVDDVVRCCISKNMSIHITSDAARATPFSTGNWHERVTRQVAKMNRIQAVDPAKITSYFQPSEMGGRDTPIERTALFIVKSYVDAETQNANANFLRELSLIATGMGHRVEIHALEKQHLSLAADKPPELIKSILLSTTPLSSVHELESVYDRIINHQASEEDKWRYFLTSYLKAWSLQRVDKAFLDQFGTMPNCPQVSTLLDVLTPSAKLDLGRSDKMAVDERQRALKVHIVRELIAGLGLRSPFDSETKIMSLMDVYEQTLRHQELFKNYNDMARIFRSDVHLTGEWDAKKLAKSIGMVFSSVGLSISRTRSYSTVREGPPPAVPTKTQRVAKSTYTLDNGAVGTMLELVKMRTMARNTALSSIVNVHAREALSNATPVKWKHLLVGGGDEGLVRLC